MRFIFLAIAGIITVYSQNLPSDAIHGGHGIRLGPPPPTERKPVSEVINGTSLTDPFRWLEDAHSPATRTWIESQIKYTDSYLSQVKIRPEIVNRLTELERVESVEIPVERGGKYFFKKRLAQENQGSIYLRRGLRGTDERLVDARTLSTDQNTSVEIDDISKDGTLLVYGIREGGADEETPRVLDVNKRQDLADTLPKARYMGIAVSPDKSGVYYSKFEPAGTMIYFHRIGSPANADTLVFGKSFQHETFGPMELILAYVSNNCRYLIITVHHGVPAKRIDVYAKDLRVPNSPIRPIIRGIDHKFYPDNWENDLYVMTDDQAENYRVVKVSMSDPAPAHWQTIVPEGRDVISNSGIVGGKLFVTGLHEVVTQTRVFSLDGNLKRTISYPALGSASPVIGRQDSDEAFYSFESFNMPQTIYRYDVSSNASEVFHTLAVPFDSTKYEVQQVFYKSKDGTRIPMFVSGNKGAKHDGTTPVLLSAYGGFNISLTPYWNSACAWWMEQGGFCAQPNLRGGGEYGETWHKAGMFEHKQNVFDDFFAAAEYLIANKFTSPEHLAISGRSNGGLLMGAAMTQRPDLFGAIWCGYPLLDMIRFQNFLVGRWWTAEYGSSEDATQFRYLLKYSPYQNVKPGTKYPAIMFSTGDSDTRVDPLHARKMTALMQTIGSTRPILLHYEVQAGHSSGVSVTQEVNDTADQLAFLWNETGR